MHLQWCQCAKFLLEACERDVIMRHLISNLNKYDIFHSTRVKSLWNWSLLAIAHIIVLNVLTIFFFIKNFDKWRKLSVGYNWGMQKQKWCLTLKKTHIYISKKKKIPVVKKKNGNCKTNGYWMVHDEYLNN